MCDTMVALGDATSDGSVIFAKNSDRDPNEAHELIIIPAEVHAADTSVQCTYVQVPQVRQTNQVLLAKPFWIWGAEMGANEHGVVIGNEAVFTRVPYDKTPGLIGMDFIRLALERAASARDALDVITDLLAIYGQGGNCGLSHKLYYHNSFLLADPNEAWVLETAGRHWAAEKVREVRSISNAITIGKTWDLASDDLVRHALARGWCRQESDFDFGKCYSDFLYTRFSYARQRQCRTTDLLRSQTGRITPKTMMSILRDHGPDRETDWSPARGIFWGSVCCHAGPGPVRISQSVGSMVSHLTSGIHTHWLTGTSAPCTGVFKPVWMDAGLPVLGASPTERYDAATLWWRHEALHREVMRDYAARLACYRDERDELEDRFMKGVYAAGKPPAHVRRKISTDCFREANDATEQWYKRVHAIEPKRRPSAYYRLAWRNVNRKAGIPN